MLEQNSISSDQSDPNEKVLDDDRSLEKQTNIDEQTNVDAQRSSYTLKDAVDLQNSNDFGGNKKLDSIGKNGNSNISLTKFYRIFLIS